MAEKKEVVVATDSHVAPIVYDSDMLSQGTGLEEAGAGDYAIPFLRVLQSMSPQLKKSDGQYIQGAEEGNLYNTVSGNVYDGNTGVEIVPCAYKNKFIEWVTREQGGGFVTDEHSANDLKSCTKDDSGRFILPNGNQLSETVEYYSLICENEHAPEEVLLSLTSSALGFSRRWNTMMNTTRVMDSEGNAVQAPMFAYIYKLTTVAVSNDQYSWMGLSVEKARPTPPHLAKDALSFMKAARAGDVQVKQEQEGVSDSEDVPF